MKKKRKLAVMITITIVIIIFFIKLNENHNIKQTTITTISEDEINLYENIIMKENKYLNEQELNESVKGYAEEVYAQFYLGAEYGLCKPFSYEALKMAVEAENNNRAAKKTSEEVVYGVMEYSIDEYLNYILSNLKLNIVDYLVKNYDSNLEKEAKKYFKNNIDKFQTIKKVKYRIGNEIKVADKNSLIMMQKINPDLFENLCNSDEGEKFSIDVNSELFDCEIINKEISSLDFDDEKEIILNRYISDVYYWDLVDSVKEFNKVELINN